MKQSWFVGVGAEGGHFSAVQYVVAQQFKLVFHVIKAIVRFIHPFLSLPQLIKLSVISTHTAHSLVSGLLYYIHIYFAGGRAGGRD